MQQLVIISGRSGSGKTIALHALEDLGFYCIDNLPVRLLLTLDQEALEHKVAISIDARNLDKDLQNFTQAVNKLNAVYKKTEIIYLDAHENTLLKRFSETRRKHPLTSNEVTLREAIRTERNILLPIANLADFTLDTTEITRHELHNIIGERTKHQVKTETLQLLVQSFGFKYGLPPDSDFVFDLRCLPNPYWQSELRMLTGLDTPVIDYLEKQSLVQQMIEHIALFIKEWVPKFQADDRSYMTISLGCTGGKHRSVYFAVRLAKQIAQLCKLDNIQLRHRELTSGRA